MDVKPAEKIGKKENKIIIIMECGQLEITFSGLQCIND